jgi:hypothetical protein
MKRTSFLILTLCLMSFLAAAQVEICNDGIDNDGDGFIDCYDGSCANIGACDGTFLGNDAKCEAKPAEFPKFTMTLDFASPNETTNHLARTAVGDLDRDGIPEIITMNRYTKKVIVLNGRTGQVKSSLSAPFTPQWEVAIANIDNDNCAEIFTFGNEGSQMYLYSYNCDLTTQLWKTKISGDPINFGVADFNGDGKVEVYAKDEIYDAKTGTRLIKSKNWSDMNGGPVAVDMGGTEDLELVVGGYIYSVDLGPGTQDGGTLTEINKISDYYIRFDFNATSVADYNLDGNLDVIISGSTVKKGKNTTVFFWDVANNTVKTFFDNTPGSYQPNGWDNGTGRINIADLDGDGKMNVSYVSGKFLYALDENLNLFWRKVINEETSGHTGCTLFDFNGDGRSEIVYRDEQFLYIINGNDGSVYNQQNCISRTNREYPIVADVDADGSTEICVPCGFSDKDSWDNFDDLNYSQYSHIRVYKSASEPWVPARRVWNQHGYFNVNVNDDLTIPKRQQKHHLVFSTGSCTTGPNRPLNGFLNQSPFLNSLGCPTYASPDLAHVENSLVVNQPTCPDKKFTVSFRITNKGDQILDGDVPITFYNGNAAAPGAVKLGTIIATLSQFGPGDEFAITNAEVNGPGGEFTLYIVLNDNGSTVPTPISLPNTNFIECDYSNNIIFAPILPKGVPIVASTTPNAHCYPGSTTPHNGTATAFVQLAGGPNTNDFNFYWFKGTVDASPDFVGVTYTGIQDGSYQVFARHKTAQCNSDTVTVTVGLDQGPLVVTIQELAKVTDCKNPNGGLKAIPNSKGQPPSAFTYAWYKGNVAFTTPMIGNNQSATGLEASTYTVFVTEKLSGCTTTESKAVQSNTVIPVTTATPTDIVCSSANSGKLDATADGKTTGYTFEWFNGNVVKPSPDFTGANATSKAPGSYTLVAVNDATKCLSVPTTVTITQTPAPVVTATSTADMTSCDVTKPNGSANASVTGGPAGFTFEWFKGTTLTAGNKIGTTPAISNLAAGTYTVRATQTATGCSDTDKVVINLNMSTPTLLATPTHVTTCIPPNGSVTATPSMDTPGDYTYEWFIGAGVSGTPIADTDNTITGLVIGKYTVRATHKTKFCDAAPVTVEVLDNSPAITMSLDGTATTFPSDCNANNGVMKVDVVGGTGSGFDIDWHAGRLPFTAGVIHHDGGVTTSTAGGLKAGVYTVTATDVGSGCKKEDDFDLPFANQHSLDIVSIDQVTTCVPGNDGAVTVKLNKSPLAGFVEADYDILVYQGTNDLNDGSEIRNIPGVTATLNYSTDPPLDLVPGDYTFVAVSNNATMLGCRSIPKVAKIEKQTNDPVVATSAANASTNCAGMTGNGSINLNIDSGSPFANYTYQWFNGGSVTDPPIAGTQTIAGLDPGLYTVRVTGTTGSRTGCFSIATIPIGSSPTTIDIAGSGLTTVDLMSCNAATGDVIANGSATVTTIIENGGPGSLGNYTFQWTKDDGSAIGGATPTVNALAAGDYFVLATSTVSNCSVSIPFAIEDATIGTIGVELVSFIDPQRCLGDPADPNMQGTLQVQATGSGAATNTISWYNGATATGPVIRNGVTLDGITVPGGFSETTKTVLIQNTANNCRVVDSYKLPLIVNVVRASASSSPLTSCITNDGSVFGTVVNDVLVRATPMIVSNYDLNWYNGTSVKASADFTADPTVSLLVSSLGEGDYTFQAVDTRDNFCKSPSITVTITKEQEMPVVIATVSAPMSNCDPTKANGSALATVQVSAESADFVNTLFDYKWFSGGIPIAGAATSFYTGNDPSGLDVGTYAVRATNRTSGCSGEASISIIQLLAPIPSPDIVVLQNVTSCVDDNGIMTASVGGNTADYIFNWYVGKEATGTIFDHNEMIDSLTVDFYTVTATSRITGCTTGPDTDQIIKDVVIPDFDFKIIPATCNGENGFASLVMTSNVPIETIEWRTSTGVIAAGPNLENIGAGTYQVTVVSELGCIKTKDVEVGTEIRPHNGVSRNNDGRNEIFNISCIENFPGNNVKIYNRAGTMVYEGDGYNNVDIYFDGKSNKGVSPMGVLLPDGTYFYVIDKRDGSKPLAGYLEIVK